MQEQGVFFCIFYPADVAFAGNRVYSNGSDFKTPQKFLKIIIVSLKRSVSGWLFIQ